MARADGGTDSDIDLLVEMADDRSLLDRVALEQELESLLNRPVDVLTTQRPRAGYPGLRCMLPLTKS